MGPGVSRRRERDLGETSMKVSRARGAGPAASLFFTALATAWTLRLWDWRPGTPFGMRGDEVFIHAQIKTTLETGWFWSNPRLGAPFEMAGYLFPETSVLQLAAIRMIGPITD